MEPDNPAISPLTLDDCITILSINDCRFSIEQRASNRKSKIDNRKFQRVGVPVLQRAGGRDVVS